MSSIQESNSVNVGQNPKITPSPRKSSLNLNNNDGSLGFTEDPIMGELTCKTCPYQCYGTTKMLKHINACHSDLIPPNAESSSGTPETKKRKLSQSSAPRVDDPPKAKRPKLTRSRSTDQGLKKHFINCLFKK